MSDCCPEHAGSRGRCRGRTDELHVAFDPPGDWIEQAECRGLDTDIFFPEPGDHQQAIAAKLICSECPVREACETHFIDEKHGIFGGRTPNERTDIRMGRPRPFKAPRWFTCAYCGRDVATLDDRQTKCSAIDCRDAYWRATQLPRVFEARRAKKQKAS